MSLNDKVRGVFAAYGQAADGAALAQLYRCLDHEAAVAGALMADHHKGYSMPIGGVVAYDGYLSPSGVGFDIGCGNEAVLTDAYVDDFEPDEWAQLADEIAEKISFGVGRVSNDRDAQDHAVHDNPLWAEVPPWVRKLRDQAREQFSTVGGGNHYVNVMADSRDRVWVCNHFGSRGLGSRFRSRSSTRGFSPPCRGRICWWPCCQVRIRGPATGSGCPRHPWNRPGTRAARR